MNIIDDYRLFFNNGTPIDRSWTLDGIVERSEIKIPDFFESDITLEKCIENRVMNIKQQYKNIALLWSGGIDSTLVFYALKKYNVNVTVLYTDVSIVEYPKLSSEIINSLHENITNSINISHTKVNLDDYDVVLNGEGADQLIGSDRWLRYSKNQLNDDFHNQIFIDSLCYFERAVRTVIKKEVISLKEFLWCVNFIFNYCYVIKIAKELNHNVTPFFDTEDFSIWSMNNFEDNLKHDNPIYYKYNYKKFIYSMNNDDVYFNIKMKSQSMYKLRNILLNGEQNEHI